MHTGHGRRRRREEKKKTKVEEENRRTQSSITFGYTVQVAGAGAYDLHLQAKWRAGNHSNVLTVLTPCSSLSSLLCSIVHFQSK